MLAVFGFEPYEPIKFAVSIPENGASGGLRTPNLVVRSHVLYPIELQMQKKMVRQSGIEPLTRNLEGYWSIRLTYWRINVVDRRGFEPRTLSLKGRC